jgi:hypothetical protein
MNPEAPSRANPGAASPSRPSSPGEGKRKGERVVGRGPGENGIDNTPSGQRMLQGTTEPGDTPRRHLKTAGRAPAGSPGGVEWRRGKDWGLERAERREAGPERQAG